MWELEATVTVTEPGLLVAAERIVRQVVEAVDRACSRFRSDSELVALQPRMAAGVTVSPMFRLLLERALGAARMTDGDVDPTLGADLAALGHGPDIPGDAPEPPTGGAGTPGRPGIRSVPLSPLPPSPVPVAPRTPGWARVRLDPPHGQKLPSDALSLDALPPDALPSHTLPGDATTPDSAVLTVPAGLHLDLGASAKAVAADLAAAEVYRRLGCGVLVSLGGDLASAGPGPQEGQAEGKSGHWQILVQDLPSDPAQHISLAQGFALATSSTQKRRWQHQGTQVHHILDPRFGLPAEAVWRSVTVSAPTCLEANAFSTAAVVRGFRALDWFRTEGIPARFVDTRGMVTTTGGWPADSHHPAETFSSDESLDSEESLGAADSSSPGGAGHG
ncbi:thiamine biosynthesis lipoprotein [Pseudarthrobacter defluvii]|uniref:FAD:protein FMN transferase n=1 Tax=Pseudarthrobacter defluvii TaxID=410837 RepID=UPI002784307C|nr:FAD:protein FMN transferase [Pseudarthrobacter defluvii]MDQ0769910.1 thiamine biosynthesis lipoprotein [Pseudarthrobacter defluvii]